MKILTIIGARPQFIKAGTLSRYINGQKEISEVIVHTGQHYDNNMSRIFFDELKIPKPNYNLNIGGLGHGEMTGKMMEMLEPIVIKEKPDFILVYGDTNSTLAGALVAVKLKIKIAHVEAGLRSYNMSMPEEINRIITDRISNFLFCPTNNAINNLKKEGFDSFDVNLLNVGDIMYEGSLFYRKIKKRPNRIEDGKFILSTFHRAENTDSKDNLMGILSALIEIAKSQRVIVPLHPRTKKLIEKLNLPKGDILFIDPVSYLEMNWLLSNCDFVITDSGGLQKEAYFYSKPCITMRQQTEWIELIDNNVNILVGTNKEKIVEASNLSWFKRIGFNKLLYGDGTTSSKIIEALKSI